MFLRLKKSVVLSLLTGLLVSFGSASFASAQTAPAAPKAPRAVAPQSITPESLGFTKVDAAGGIVEYTYTANGLKVLLIENHSAPVVTSELVYHVGSRNESYGTTGATHFLEHMMFKDTTHYRDIMDVLKPYGAELNASTWFDRTAYYEVVPSKLLELILTLDSDRMRNLTLRQSDHDSEMTVVRNEMERGENDSGRVLWDKLYSTAFMEHPYHHPTIGWRSDVEGVSIDGLRNFYNTFYWPNNATLIISGDFRPTNALYLIAKTYGKVAHSPKPIPQVYTVEAPQPGERRFEIRQAGDLPQVIIGFHVPRAEDADTYPLAAIASILQPSATSGRLYERLIKTGLAASVGVNRENQHDPGLFSVNATVAPGVKVQDVEKALEDELAKFATTPVTADELDLAKQSNRKSTILSGVDPVNVASQLAEAEACCTWHWWVNFDANYDKVTAADIQRVAATYFLQTNRTVGIFDPTPTQAAPDTAHLGTAKATATVKPPAQRPSAPRLTIAPQGKSASIATQVTRTVLANGMVVMIMRDSGSGAVSLNGSLPVGKYVVAGKNTMLPGVTAAMLNRGTTTQSGAQIQHTLDSMGAGLDFGSGRFSTGFASTIVATDMPAYLNLLADLVRNPTFPDSELTEMKKQYAASLEQSRSDTGDASDRALKQALYPKDSVYYSASIDELEGQLNALTSADLSDFHSHYYSPNGMILTIVGDVNVDETLALVKAKFGNWQGAAPQPIVVASTPMPASAQMVQVAIPDKSNVDILVAHPVELRRNAPDYLAAKLANSALGGDTLTSRLGLTVRVKDGYTYGVYSSFEDVTEGGAPWEIGLSVNPANVDKAVKAVDEVWAEFVKNGITDQELSDGAGTAAGNFIVRLRTADGIAGVLTGFEENGLGISAIDTYANDLKAVTRAQVNAAIKKYFHPEAAVTVEAGTLKK